MLELAQAHATYRFWVVDEQTEERKILVRLLLFRRGNKDQKQGLIRVDMAVQPFRSTSVPQGATNYRSDGTFCPAQRYIRHITRYIPGRRRIQKWDRHADLQDHVSRAEPYFERGSNRATGGIRANRRAAISCPDHREARCRTQGVDSRVSRGEEKDGDVEYRVPAADVIYICEAGFIGQLRRLWTKGMQDMRDQYACESHCVSTSAQHYDYMGH